MSSKETTAPKSATEMNDESFERGRKLKARFVDTDKAQMAACIKDLEKTLQINKEIMTDLFAADSKSEGGQKRVLENLNRENVQLAGQIKRAIKERDDAQAKLLISEQLVENLQEKEQELAADFAERERELMAQLDRKEYEFQRAQQRLDSACMLLAKYAGGEVEVKQFTKNAKDSADSPQKISNVIEESEELRKELTAARKRAEELEMADHDLRTLNEQLTLSLNEMRVFGGKPAKSTVPVLDFSKIRRPDYKAMSDSGYMHKLEESIKLLSKRAQELEAENRELLQKNMQFQNANASLLKLNTDLSQTLQEIREQARKLPAHRRPADPQNRSFIVSPGTRLITSPALIKGYGAKDHRSLFRQVTEHTNTAPRHSRNEEKASNTSVGVIVDEPKPVLKGKREGEMSKFATIAAGKDQSFGELPAGAEVDHNLKLSDEDDEAVRAQVQAFCKD